MEEIESQILTIEAQKKQTKKLTEADKIELKRLKRLKNARLYRYKVKLQKQQSETTASKIDNTPSTCNKKLTVRGKVGKV